MCKVGLRHEEPALKLLTVY